jgi:hypothetical protein
MVLVIFFVITQRFSVGLPAKNIFGQYMDFPKNQEGAGAF